MLVKDVKSLAMELLSQGFIHLLDLRCDLVQQPGAALRLVVQYGERVVDPLATNKVRNGTNLPGTNAGVSMFCGVSYCWKRRARSSAG